VAPHYITAIRRKTHARLLYYTHDLHWLREQRRYEIEGDPLALLASERIKPIEIDIFKTVDCVTTPSVEEAAVIADLVPGTEVRVLPPYLYKIDSKVILGGSPLELCNKIIFVGGYAHLPNVDAAKVLVENIMPLVWRSVPGARVMLVGSDPPPEVCRLAADRVEVVGYVRHLEPYYQQARMSVSPLRYGAGVKGKIISSLEQGVPVVTTPIGNEGIDLKPGAEVLIGETPAEIAAHVVQLFEDTALLHSLAEAGWSVIRARFSEEKARDAFLGALHL
jgi:glycosyltransferase involved in cell wall biosynthesis